MEIKLLNKNFKNNEKLYYDFKNDRIDFNADYFTDEYITIDKSPDFPIYFGEKRIDYTDQYIEAVKVIINNYIELDRSIHLNGIFWFSLMMYKRDYIFKKYSSSLKDIKNLNNIVFKAFNWENYIYKCVIMAEYLTDAGINEEEKIEKYVKIMVNNLDVYNYLIKSKTYRNSEFVLKFLLAIDELGISNIMKRKLPTNDGKDKRVGRNIISELNLLYPLEYHHLYSLEELKEEVMIHLEKYLSEADKLNLEIKKKKLD